MHFENKNISIYILLIILFGLYSCTKRKDDIITKNTTPYLNKKDSLLMVKIYEKIGPWGNVWNLQDIDTWCGVNIAHDTLLNEFRIVGFNYFGSFHGDFPEEFTLLTELRRLGLGGGTLSGNIPPNIINLEKLEWLYIGYNNVYGQIPTEIGQLHNLKELTLGENYLSGTLPEELGNLVNLERLIITATEISGEIPQSWSKLNKAQFIYLDKNKLSGKFPVKILSQGRVISCSHNNITSISFDIWDDKFSFMPPDLQWNRLSGEVPKWVYETDRWNKYSFFVKNQQKGFGYE